MDFPKERPAEADAPPHINLEFNVDRACTWADLWQRVCLRRMDFIVKRLAEADTQYTELVDQLETAKEQWLNETDPASKKTLEIIDHDSMSMVERICNRIMQLEAGMSGNGVFRPSISACTLRDVLIANVCQYVCPIRFLMPSFAYLSKVPATLAERLNCSCVLLLPNCRVGSFVSDSHRVRMVVNLS